MDLLGKGMGPEFWKEVREKECFEKCRDELHFLLDQQRGIRGLLDHEQPDLACKQPHPQQEIPAC